MGVGDIEAGGLNGHGRGHQTSGSRHRTDSLNAPLGWRNTKSRKYGSDRIENIIRSSAHPDSPNSAAHLIKKIRAFKDIYADIQGQKDIPLGMKGLRQVDPSGAELGSTGQSNSRTMAKAMPMLRAVNRSPKIDGRGANALKADALLPSTEKKRRHLFSSLPLKAVHTKDLAKTTQNNARLGQIPGDKAVLNENLDNIAHSGTAPTPFDVAVGSAAIVEYGAGIKVAIDSLLRLQKRDNLLSLKRDELDRLVRQAHNLAIRKEAVASAIDKNDSTGSSSHHLKQTLEMVNGELEAHTSAILALAYNIEALDDGKAKSERTVSVLKLLRYCVSIVALSLQFIATATSGKGAERMLFASFGSATGSGALAAALDGDSLGKTVGSARESERYKDTLAQAIAGYKKEKEKLEETVLSLTTRLETQIQGSNLGMKKSMEIARELDDAHQRCRQIDQDVSVLSMALRKQPTRAINALNVASKILTTSGYCAAATAGAATIAVLAGSGAAAGVVLMVSPVGWGLAGAGAALILGIVLYQGGMSCLHRRNLSRFTRDITGSTRNFQSELGRANPSTKVSLGSAHHELMTRQHDTEKLPGKSSRAAIDWLFNQLLDDFGDFLAISPELAIQQESIGRLGYCLINPLKGMASYCKSMERSRAVSLLRNTVKDKGADYVDEQVCRSMEAVRVGQVSLAKSIIGNLMQIKGKVTERTPSEAARYSLEQVNINRVPTPSPVPSRV